MLLKRVLRIVTPRREIIRTPVMPTTITTMHIEPNEAAQSDQIDAANGESPPIELQDADSRPSDRRFATPERAPSTRRNLEDEGQVPHPKTRRLS